MTDDTARNVLIYRIQRLIASAYRSHQAALHPPSGYCATVSNLANSRTYWSEAQLLAFGQLMRGASCSSWDPASRDAANWLYVATSGNAIRLWRNLPTEELERLAAVLEE